MTFKSKDDRNDLYTGKMVKYSVPLKAKAVWQNNVACKVCKQIFSDILKANALFVYICSL